MSRPTHFDFTATDPERASKFYQEAFGWSFSKWDGPMDYWLITTGEEGSPGINGGMGRRQDDGHPGTTNTLDVADLDAAAAKIQAAGGKITVPKMAIPGIGWLAYGEDTEGNAFGIMQDDPSASEG